MAGETLKESRREVTRLGLLVMYGIKGRDHKPKNPPGPVQALMFQDRMFQICLRIAILDIRRHALINRIPNWWKEAFKKRLLEIFPEPLADKVFRFTLMQLLRDRQKGCVEPTDMDRAIVGAREHELQALTSPIT